MSNHYSDYIEDELDIVEEGKPDDDLEEYLAKKILELFSLNPKKVFYQRQLQVYFEDDCFHWITARVLKKLREAEAIGFQPVEYQTNAWVAIYFDKTLRDYKRAVKDMIDHVKLISHPRVTRGVGEQLENLVLRGFAENGFKMLGSSTKKLKDLEWTDSDHNLDFIFEKHGLVYGIEVKNTLNYIEKAEFKTKILLCEHLGITPVFIVRMMPKHWIYEVIKKGGFVLVLKYQLFPLYFEDDVVNSSKELGIPVGSPKKLRTQTMKRFMTWHNKRIPRRSNPAIP